MPFESLNVNSLYFLNIERTKGVQFERCNAARDLRGRASLSCENPAAFLLSASSQVVSISTVVLIPVQSRCRRNHFSDTGK